MSPKENLTQSINNQIDLFQTTIGKNNANTIATTTIVLDSLGKTILAQYEKITSLENEVANLKALNQKDETSENKDI